MNTDDLVFGLLIVNVVLLGGAVRFYHVAWIVRDTLATSRLVITQSKRYQMLVFGQLICALAVEIMLIMFSPSEIRSGFSATLDTTGWFGYLLLFGAALTCLSPLFTIVVAVSIYRKPAALAREAFSGHYLSTRSLRNGTPRLYTVSNGIDPETEYPHRLYTNVYSVPA